jgi:hypothetical protein
MSENNLADMKRERDSLWQWCWSWFLMLLLSIVILITFAMHYRSLKAEVLNRDLAEYKLDKRTGKHKFTWVSHTCQTHYYYNSNTLSIGQGVVTGIDTTTGEIR